MKVFVRLVSRVFVPVVFLLALVACGVTSREGGGADPLETQNRAVHQANRSIDRAFVRPAATGYGTALPAPVRKGVNNFAANLNLPGQVLNDLLQFRIEDAGANTFRFLLNSTFGLAGVLDVATEAGLANRRTDFGETLHVWGVPEGAYLELPLVGPSTERHAAGRVVDTLINPMNFILPKPESSIVMVSGVAARFGDRYQYSDLVDSVLYESEDSYAQARLLYLQNRRFHLSGGKQQEFFDPYEDIYGED